jgi:hypothetical protein
MYNASYREGSPEGTVEEARIWDHPKKVSLQISLVRNLWVHISSLIFFPLVDPLTSYMTRFFLGCLVSGWWAHERAAKAYQVTSFKQFQHPGSS